MELKGEQHIPLEREAVWAALNDPALLKASIPGCESIDETAENEYAVTMLAAIGPVKARFKGKLAVSEMCPPESYTLTFEGSGGAAGFGKGGAKVALASVEGGTLLSYQANAQVGGKIAQVGSRLIDGVAAKMAAEFFTRFKAALAAPEDTQQESGEQGGEQGAKPRRWKLWGKAAS